MSTNATRLFCDVPRRLRGVLRDERGMALVFVLLALTVVTALALTSLVDSQIESQSVAATQDSKMALYAADGGVQEALMRINYQNRTDTRTVNGASTPIWIPWDLVTTGSTPATWTFVHDDGVNNGAGSATPCGGSGASDCSGYDSTVDDWAEMYPGWQAHIWAASQTWVDDNLSNLPTGAEHYATLFDVTSRVPLIDFGISADPAALGGVGATRGNIFIKRKLSSAGQIIFTDGVRQFTSAEAFVSKADGGVGLTPPGPGGLPPAWPVFEIWSTGRANNTSRRLVAEVSNFPNKMPETALYVCGDLANGQTVEGTGAFLVSGYDYQIFEDDGTLIDPPNGNHTEGMQIRDPNVPATAPVVATTVCCDEGPSGCTDVGDETEAVTAQIAGGQYFGADSGDGDTFQVGEMDVQAIFDSFVPFISPAGCGARGCDVTNEPMSSMGSETNFVVARITATSGTLASAVANPSFGVLLVDVKPNATVSIGGNTTVYGLFIVVGGGDLSVQGTFKTIGAAYVSADVGLQGNFMLLYSRDALKRIPRIMQARILRFWESLL